MLRKQVSPKIVAIATLVILALIQAVYWRLLVYREAGPPGGGGGGGGGPMVAVIVGREDVLVESLVGGGPGYRDGAGWQAQLNGPNALAVEPDGSLLVADSRNHRIRRMNPRGSLITVAGGEGAGEGGGRRDGPALEALFRFPSGVAVGEDGAIYIADTGNHRICRLVADRVMTLAGGPEGEAGKADGIGSGARFRFPASLVWEGQSLWVADLGNAAVRRVEPDGRVTTPVEVPAAVRNALGDVDSRRSGQMIRGSDEGLGFPMPVDMQLGRRSAAARLGSGYQVFADPEYHAVMAQRGEEPPMLLAGRRFAGQPSSPGSNDGMGNKAGFAVPCAAVVGTDGRIYVADYEGNRIRRLRLPNWMTAGSEPPQQQRGRWRRDRGR